MKIASWNVNGIRARESQFCDWQKQEQPDVICLQEIKASPLQIPPSIMELPDYWCYWYGLGGYSGVALHLKKSTFPEKPNFTHPSFDLETRIVAAQSGNQVFASVYVPNGGKDFVAKMRFLEALRAYVQEQHAAGISLVICGDINVALADIDVHPKERKPKIIGQLPEERKILQDMLGAGLADVLRRLHPEDDAMFTWWPPWRNMRQRNIGWRIDYILASEPWMQKVKSCVVHSAIGTSDHAPLVAEFT